MSDLFDSAEGATPLDPDEREGLRLSWVTSRGDLNRAEQANIEKATVWAMRTRHRDILSVPFVVGLHKGMFGDVWTWAGTYRTTRKNIGIEAFLIPVELAKSLDSARYWIENETYNPDEIAVHLHHQLVSIHPFPNGNGRWARLMADVLIVSLGGERFTWGRGSFGSSGKARAAYIEALREADRHDIEPLLAFARSRITI
jgi:Fic-DOC domain mobile mystery protein B